MRVPGKKLIGYKSRKYFANAKNSNKAVSMTMNQNGFKVVNNRRCYLTPGYLKKRACKRKNNLNDKSIETLPKKSNCNRDKCISSFKLTGKRTCFSVGKNSKNFAGTSVRKSVRRKGLKRTKKNIVQDEVSRLQRRARYLLIKMKLEQNLIDAYSGDGWKGQSREKIKPEKELQRAQRQILKCKLGIRDSIHQLDLLGSEGRIEDSVMHPDGSVFHEHIFCAKCKSREAFHDNDIILCDGNCNCGFHQKCLEPPLEKIPPGDQGWLCKICNCKMEILETINAHLGTCFTVNSSWEDIFKEAIVGSDAEGECRNLVEDWPSDDSEDEDYCPDINKAEFEQSFSDDVSDDACSSFDSIVSSDASLNFISSLGSSESGDDITNYRRQRRDVDYKKLYDEMFGKEPNEGAEQSEDEDWGPYRKKKVRIASDIGINSPDGKNKVNHEKLALGDTFSCNKRSFLRIPPDAIENLRQIFDKNELPSRIVKENLSKQLGISVEKVDRWFKNTRYAAIKMRKAEASNQSDQRSDVSIVNGGHGHVSEAAVSLDSSCLLPLASIFDLPRHKKRIHRSENLTSAAFSVKKQEGAATTVRSSGIQMSPLKKVKIQLVQKTKGGQVQLPPRIEVVVVEAARLEAVVEKLFGEVKAITIAVNTLMITFEDLGSALVEAKFDNLLKTMASVRSQLKNAAWLKKHTITRDRILTSKNTTAFVPEEKHPYLNEMQMIWVIERRLHQMKQRLLACKDDNEVQVKNLSGEVAEIYVPVAEVKEKASCCEIISS